LVNAQSKLEIAAPAKAVWLTVKDFSGICKILPMFDMLECNGNTPGSIRKLASADGVLIERLESLDNSARVLCYSIIEPTPDETTILRFRRLLEKHKLAEQMLATVNELLSTKGLMLKTGTVVDATLIAAPSSTKNASGERDPEMHQAKKGNQWHFGMKAHIGVDAQSGMVHTVRGTSANVNDVVEANSLLHGQETDVHGDAGYQGAAKRPDAKPGVNWHIAMRPGKRKALDKTHPVQSVIDQIERLKASIRAKVEHPFRVIKRQFGHVKVRYRGLKKNTAQLTTLFALSNLWMARSGHNGVSKAPPTPKSGVPVRHAGC
jgi:IS5 family transposase